MNLPSRQPSGKLPFGIQTSARISRNGPILTAATVTGRVSKFGLLAYPLRRMAEWKAVQKCDGGADNMQETADQYRQRMFSYLNGPDPAKMPAPAPARLGKLLNVIS